MRFDAVCEEVAAVELLEGRVRIVCAPEYIVVSQRFIDRPVSQWITAGDGILTLRGVNGTASYGLYDFEPNTQTWRGRRGYCDLAL